MLVGFVVRDFTKPSERRGRAASWGRGEGPRLCLQCARFVAKLKNIRRAYWWGRMALLFASQFVYQGVDNVSVAHQVQSHVGVVKEAANV